MSKNVFKGVEFSDENTRNLVVFITSRPTIIEDLKTLPDETKAFETFKKYLPQTLSSDYLKALESAKWDEILISL